MANINIDPISGFPEFLPEEQIVFNRVIEVIRSAYERAGAVPIETPAVERTTTLLAKGGTDKEIYGLRRLAAEEGDDEKDLALHFDLTVPLARYVAQHANRLVFPFRRYQIQPVWRGERAQAGRYRQFYQCDIDVIGKDGLSLLNDAEIPFIMYQIFSELKIGHFFIRINNRKIMQAFFESKGADSNKAQKALKIIDSLEKNGTGYVAEKLKDIGLDAHVDSILEFFSVSGSNEEILKYLKSQNINPLFELGVEELSQVIKGVDNLGVPSDFYGIDLSIARGLDYYTGTVYETRLTGHSSLGSICSGGRFDNLASYFTDEKYPGVGMSIGLTRLLPKLFQLKILSPAPQTVADVLVTSIESDRKFDYLKIGGKLRDAGINTEVYLEDKKLSAQMKYANKKGFRYTLLCGQKEFDENSIILRNMETGDEEISFPSLISVLQHRLIRM